MHIGGIWEGEVLKEWFVKSREVVANGFVRSGRSYP